MLSVPHLIVIFVIVLIVFGPQKLPELARGLGKMMAEFRKASSDFRFAFEEEMRAIERQTLEVKRAVAPPESQPSAPPEERPSLTAGTVEPPTGAESLPGDEPRSSESGVTIGSPSESPASEPEEKAVRDSRQTA